MAHLTYTYISKKVMQMDILKQIALPISPFVHKQLGGRRQFGFIQSASGLVCPSFFLMLESFKKLETLTCKRRIFSLSTNIDELT